MIEKTLLTVIDELAPQVKVKIILNGIVIISSDAITLRNILSYDLMNKVDVKDTTCKLKKLEVTLEIEPISFARFTNII